MRALVLTIGVCLASVTLPKAWAQTPAGNSGNVGDTDPVIVPLSIGGDVQVNRNGPFAAVVRGVNPTQLLSRVALRRMVRRVVRRRTEPDLHHQSARLGSSAVWRGRNPQREQCSLRRTARSAGGPAFPRWIRSRATHLWLRVVMLNRPRLDRYTEARAAPRRSRSRPGLAPRGASRAHRSAGPCRAGQSRTAGGQRSGRTRPGRSARLTARHADSPHPGSARPGGTAALPRPARAGSGSGPRRRERHTAYPTRPR